MLLPSVEIDRFNGVNGPPRTPLMVRGDAPGETTRTLALVGTRAIHASWYPLEAVPLPTITVPSLDTPTASVSEPLIERPASLSQLATDFAPAAVQRMATFPVAFPLRPTTTLPSPLTARAVVLLSVVNCRSDAVPLTQRTALHEATAVVQERPTMTL